MNFANVKSLVIPEGSVTQIADSLGTVLWKAVTGPDYTEPFYVENITNSDEALSIVKGASEAPTISIEYSTDKTNWSALGNTDTTALTHTLHPGDKLYLRAAANTWGASGNGNYNKINGMSRVGGNIMSLIYGGNFTGQETSFPQNSERNLYYLFYGATDLQDTSKLLFPATTLDTYCYSSMFQGCTALTSAPALPATTLADNCYYAMFQGCTALTSAPALSATTLAQSCYGSMFNGCTALTTTPELPATTLANYCYASMFRGCTSLTTAPALPASTLAEYCYSGMFSGCTSLTTAPELPATTLANYCYVSMFQRCTSLTTAPELPVTTLTSQCYGNMFKDCTSLTTAPELPATTLANYCYVGMFQGCTSLTTAPELPAHILTSQCYRDMFNECSNLTYIKCLATNIRASSCLSSWVTGVAASGTFVKDANMSSWTTGNNGIPSGWTVQDAA